MATLKQIYDLVPALDCKGLCTDQCSLIPMTGPEWRHLDRADVPHSWLDLNMVFMPSEAETERQGIENVRCPLLTDDGRCSEYDRRPLICRLWGVSDGLPCPHGCRPARRVSDQESRVWIDGASKTKG